MQSLKLILIAAAIIPSAARAQDEEPVDPRFEKGLLYWLDHTDDDELAEVVAKQANQNFESNFDKLKPEVLERLDRESNDVARLLGLSGSQRRKFKLAAKGTFIRFGRQYSARYAGRMNKLMLEDRDRFFRAAHFDRSGEGPLPAANELAAELLVSPLWKKTVPRVAGNEAENYAAMLEQRTQRWLQGMIDYKVSALDRNLVLSESQVARLEKLLRGTLRSEHEKYRIRARSRPGICVEQFWGNEKRINQKTVVELLTPSQRQAIKEVGELAHFRFNGNVEDESTQGAIFRGAYTQLRQGALYLDGKYRTRGQEEMITPTLPEDSFSVCLRVKPSSATTNIITLDSWRRELSVKPAAGSLNVVMDNRRVRLPAGTTVAVDSWSTIALSVDVPKRRIIVFADNQPPGELALPEFVDFELKARDWLFTDQSNGDAFQGLVDEFLVINRAMTAGELAALPITHFFGNAPVADRNAAAPAIVESLRIRERLWLDHAVGVCALDNNQANNIKQALTQFNDTRIRDWAAEKIETDLSDPQPWREVIASNLPEDLRETYLDALRKRDERIAAQETSYATAVLENKFQLSQSQLERLSAIVQTRMSGGTDDHSADVRQLADRLLADGVLDEEQAALVEK